MIKPTCPSGAALTATADRNKTHLGYEGHFKQGLQACRTLLHQDKDDSLIPQPTVSPPVQGDEPFWTDCCMTGSDNATLSGLSMSKFLRTFGEVSPVEGPIGEEFGGADGSDVIVC